MITKLTLEATIPTVQYGNIKPTLELEGDNFEEIRDEGLQQLKSISDMTAGEGSSFEVRGLPVAQGRTILSTEGPELTLITNPLTGEQKEVLVKNDYTSIPGYKSGSKFPNQFYDPFDSKAALEMIVKAYPEAKGKEQQLMAMWELNSKASKDWGHAVHTAMENYDKNQALGKITRGYSDKAKTIFKPNKAFNRNPVLQRIVSDFHEGREPEDVLNELFVWDDDFKLSGSIDRLKIVDLKKKIVRIQDYKTDVDILEKKYMKKNAFFKNKILGADGKPDNTQITLHRLQLSFYAFILQRKGWTVEGTDLFWLNPNKLLTPGVNAWETFSHDVIDISEVITGV